MPLDHFSLIAPLYNRFDGYASLEVMLQLAALPVEGRLLDVGGGTGRVAHALRAYARQRVVVDASRVMLRYAASKPGLQAGAAASEHLPFPAASFERVIMVDALHHVANQAQTARELLRLLKPGGRIVIEEPNIRKWPVKMIALAEKGLGMRSHFLSPMQIAALFSPAETEIVEQGLMAWVVVSKP